VVETLGNGRFRVGGRLAYAARGRRGTWVFVDGRAYVIEPERRDASDDLHATDDQLALASPMPATVVAIRVSPGQQVGEGDLLVMLEAMKMELPIKAPRAGRVKALACREGELVQPGVPLVEMD
jgi:biotin carboxyl carrier protein